MFTGLSSFLADLAAIICPVLIMVAEGPQIVRRLRAFQRGPVLSLAIPEMITQAERRVDTNGLLDPSPTERVHLTEWLRGEQAAMAPAPALESEVPVLVGGGGETEGRVRPSIREHRS